MFGKSDKSGRLVRVDLFIIIMMFFAITMISTRTVSSQPLRFTKQETGYQLQRISLNKNKASFQTGGTVSIDDNGTSFYIEGEPLYPCEKNKSNEVLDIIAINYKKIMKELDIKSETDVGIVETGGNYYLATQRNKFEKEKDRYMFYVLSSYVPAQKLDFDQLLLVARSVKTAKKTVASSK